VALRWTRTALEARVDALEQRFEGHELIAAVVGFAETLTDEDRRVLQDVLLDRAKRQKISRMRARESAEGASRGASRRT
jgi:hypothetical protein